MSREKIKLQSECDPAMNSDSGMKFKIASNIIQVPYFNLFQYSQIVQQEIKMNSIFEHLSHLLQESQETAKINDQSIITFFRLLNNEEIEVKNDEFSSLMILSDLFKVESLKKSLQNYMKKHAKDIDFILSLKIVQEQNNDQSLFIEDEFSVSMEDCMCNNINQCLQNPKMKQISVSSIYRIIEKSCHEQMSNDLLYHFIMEKIEERYVLFRFLEIEKLSNESFEDICSKYENAIEDKVSFYFDFLPNNLNFIKQLKEKEKCFEEKQNKLEITVKELSKENEKYQNKIDELNKIIQQQDEKMKKELNQKDEEIEKLRSINQELEKQNKDKSSDNKILEKNNELLKIKKEQQDKYSFKIIQELVTKYGDITKFNKEGIFLIFIKIFCIMQAKQVINILSNIFFHLKILMSTFKPF